MKVLIAEDSAAERRLLEVNLARWNYAPLCVADGAEAWTILQSVDGPKLALLDWMMPGVDGIELCQRVRQANLEPYIYIILVTGRDRREDLVSGLGAGADDYIIKPFNLQELEVRMRTGKRIVQLQAELVATREQLRQEASTDALTGLLNRGAVMKILVRDYARAQRELTPLAVLMIDVDFFKPINDTYGHGGGDFVLRGLAQRMREQLRPYDALARYGGEEFMLVLPACDVTAATLVAERLRVAAASQPFRIGDIAVGVTLSIGVAVLTQGRGVTPTSLIEMADMALYRAKQNGRNQVVVNEPLSLR